MFAFYKSSPATFIKSNHGFCPPGIIFQGFGYTIIPILVYLEGDSSGTWLEIRHLSEAQHFEERARKERSVYFICVVYDRPSKVL